MAISLNALYDPLNQFFLQRFGQGDTDSVFFRFAQIPFAFYDSDFNIPLHPELSPSPALAVEQFSNLVDGVPRLDSNSTGVWIESHLISGQISGLYNDEMLGPSLPVIPENADDDVKEELIASLAKLKDDAALRWRNCRAESLINDSLPFHPSTATPQGWWTDPAVWIPQSFDIQGAATVADAPDNQVLKMKIIDSRLHDLLLNLKHINIDDPVPIEPGPLMLKHELLHQPTVMARPAVIAIRPGLAARFTRPSETGLARVEAGGMTGENIAAPAASNIALHNDLIAQSALLPVSHRMELQSVLNQNAPTESVTVTDVTISFDYCLVTIGRPWMHPAFLNNKSWYLPGQLKGTLSANDGRGLPALPVAFIALKNLTIQGPWTPPDVTNLELSTQFGPFIIDSKVVNGSIGHQGIQVVGWILQSMPDLPPNDPPLDN